MPQSQAAFKKGTIIIFMVLGVVLAVTNLLLVRENRGLRALLSERQRSLEPQVGAVVASLSGHDLDGNGFTVDYGQDSRKTLVFVFSTKCRVCDRNWPYWQGIIRSVEKGSFRLVFVNLLSPLSADYIAKYNLARFSVIADLDPKHIVEYNLRLTPQTILINPNGVIEKVWTGVLRGERLEEVAQALHMNLGDLQRAIVYRAGIRGEP